MAQQSPMPAKFRVMFFILALSVMSCFAAVGIMFSEQRYPLVLLFLFLGLMLAGFGFMTRKKLLLRLVGPKPKK
ncbi:hypothetical protein DNHGIG_23590 [Collibacillus ludicampi]|uniref:YlaF family protein n=1 Tax=Collibacillus ludicampi TaxID=2771369 RepID=A0AAV4LG56_9BACL|nr:DUF5325 family protein [Collibacillus ludicampi]GIM46810.1 hypothetical protein DNHGIG_23590 [Collibacillus ludicampi]